MPPTSYTETLPDGTTFDMVYVEGGTFMMGSEDYRSSSPVHPVRIDDYYLGRCQVTQAVWQAVMGENPASFLHPDRPIETVSWEDCQQFLEKLNALTPHTYRLPTEAQWEYAARGGKYARTELLRYAGSSNLSEVAWHDVDEGNSQALSQPARLKRPNALGLYDMSGNVYEWCEDRYDRNYYEECKAQGMVENPQGPEKGNSRVVRGGSWDYPFDLTTFARPTASTTFLTSATTISVFVSPGTEFTLSLFLLFYPFSPGLPGDEIFFTQCPNAVSLRCSLSCLIREEREQKQSPTVLR